MTDYRDWTGKVGDTWAQEWRRTDRSFRELTPRLLAAGGAAAFSRALDVGCGAGEVSLAIARANPAAEVVGVDISADLVAVAKTRGEGLANVDFVEDDAATTTPVTADRFDLLVSRHGVMFFADPPAAFAHLASVSAPGARLAFSCFRSREENGWVATTLAALPQLPPVGHPHAPGPFAFADRDRVSAILAKGGWHDVAFERLDYGNIVGEGDDPVADARDYLTRIGPTASALATLDETARASALGRLTDILAATCDGKTVSLPAAAWIVTARAV